MPYLWAMALGGITAASLHLLPAHAKLWYYLALSHSSMESLAFIFMPIYALPWALAGAVVGLLCHQSYRLLQYKGKTVVSVAAFALALSCLAALLYFQVSSSVSIFHGLGQDASLHSEYVSPDEIRQIYHDHSEQFAGMIYESIASNSQCPPDILADLSHSDRPLIRRRVAENESTPVDVIMRLATDPDWQPRAAAAKRKDLPVEKLIKMSQDENEWVLASVVFNPRTPSEILVKLADVNFQQVQVNLLHNPHTPEASLMELIKFVDPSLKLTAIRHPNVTRKILEMLCQDRDIRVKNEAEKALQKMR